MNPGHMHAHPVGDGLAHPGALMRPVARRPVKVRWALWLLLLTLAIPSTSSFNVGPLRLCPYRLVLIAGVIPLLLGLISNRFGRLVASDFLVLIYAGWACLALAVHHGPEVALESGGIYFVESVGAYLFGRCLVLNMATLDRVIRACWVVLLLLMPLVMVESLTGKHLIQSAFAAMQGRSFHSTIDTRAGFHRAFGPMDHPILWGVVSASFVAPVWYFFAGPGDRITAGRIARTLAPVMCAVTSLSSGAFTVLAVQTGLIVYERLTRSLGRRWWWLAGGVALFYIFIDTLSNRSGMKVFLSYLTFSPATAYNRLIIWEWGFHHNALVHPLFGIGLTEWTRPSWMKSTSMDNFWLVVTVTFGFVASLSLLSALLLTMRRVGTGVRATDRRRIGVVISLISLGVSGATVHFWNGSFVFFMLMLGAAAGVAVGEAAATSLVRRPVVRRPPPGGVPS